MPNPVTQHIFLNNANSVKVQALRERTGRAANDIVNTLLDNLEAIEIEETLTYRFREGDKTVTKVKKKVYRVNF